MVFLQKTDEHHDQTADHGNGVANKQNIHESYLGSIMVSVIVPTGRIPVKRNGELAKW